MTTTPAIDTSTAARRILAATDTPPTCLSRQAIARIDAALAESPPTTGDVVIMPREQAQRIREILAAYVINAHEDARLAGKSPHTESTLFRRCTASECVANQRALDAIKAALEATAARRILAATDTPAKGEAQPQAAPPPACWLVWGDRATPGYDTWPSKRHATEIDAVAECQRLAAKHPGTVFYALPVPREGYRSKNVVEKVTGEDAK